VVNEGVNVTATPTSIGEEEVSLDLVIRSAKVKSVDERPIDRDGSVIQMPTVESVEVRTTKIVRLGKKATVTCGTHSFSFVVHRMANTPAAAPRLNAVDDPRGRLSLR
jgi:hypothetical protein